MTERIYEKDSYIADFSAAVLECQKTDNGYAVVLDATAFFPEGGGQFGDTGTIDGVKVFDTQIKDGIIYHYTEDAVRLGTSVGCKLNFSRRFAFMQNHSGEHIVSAVTKKLYGLNNVGFHLGEDFVTVDFDGELTREQLCAIETAVNEYVWKNLPITAYYPMPTELESIDYRSKKQIDGDVRLVEIKGCDICACCAPHVKNTGEIGIVKLLDFERMRGGVRIVIKCGRFALDDYRVKYDNIANISALLSAKQDKAFESVNILDEKFTSERQKNIELKKKIADMTVDCADSSTKYIFLSDCETKDLQLIADRLYKKHGGIRAAFSGEDENFSFAICGNDAELQEFFAKFKAKLNVRGGGRNGMVQGAVLETAEKIKLCF